MRFFWPNILWLCLPIWLCLPLVWYGMEKKAEKQLAKFASPALLALILRGGDPKQLAGRRRTRFILGWLALLLTIFAVARPQLGVREEAIATEGLDLVFLLDVSNSMLTEDIVPSRLKKAKHLIRNFIDRLSGDRAGIVAFAGSAYPAVPLTTDYEFLKQTLDVLDEASVANQGTDLAKGLEVSHDLLMRGGLSEDDDSSHQQADSPGSRIIIIVSDGESHEGEEAKLADKLKERGIRVFSIGVGSIKGAPIPLRDQSGYSRGFKKDSSGNIVLTKLESANLEAIASKTGGKYYAASSNEGEVEEILGQLSSMERTQGGGRRVIVYDEVYQYPLALGVFLLLIMLFLREARARAIDDEDADENKTPGVKAAALTKLGLILILGLSWNTGAQASSLNEYNSTKKGVESYDDKDFASAIQLFGKAQASDPESATHHLNLGDAFLKSGSIDGAVAEFNSVLKSKSATEAGKGAFNLGKTYEEAKDFEKAIRSYQAGLERLSTDPKSDAEVEMRIKRALEQALQKKQQQQQQKQQQQQGQNQNPGQGKDDKKDENEKKKYDIPKRKPEFKAEKLAENDAKRLMKQLQEQEKKSQQRVMRAKTGKPKDDKITKDW